MDQCIICSDTGGVDALRKLGTKGLSSLVKASETRGDNLLHDIDFSRDYFVHINCQKSYTAAWNIAKAMSYGNDNQPRSATNRILRNTEQPFDYRTHCLICTDQIVTETSERHPERRPGSSNIEYVAKDKNSVMQKTLIDMCSKRGDTVSVEIRARIEFVGDLRAVEATYHRSCMQRFLSMKSVPNYEANSKNNPRNLDFENNEAFNLVCAWLQSAERQDGTLYTLQDIRTKLCSLLPKGVPAYTIKHLKRRLTSKFGPDITFADTSGMSDVVTLTTHASEILQQSYQEQQIPQDHSNEITCAAECIIEEVKRQTRCAKPADTYPNHSDIEIEKLESQVPAYLSLFMKTFLGMKKQQGSRDM